MSEVPTLTFSRSLYSEKGIDAALAAYSETVTAEKKVIGSDIIVAFYDEDVDTELLDSFSNHVLFETIRSRNSTQAG
jgi:hypothetical protein